MLAIGDFNKLAVKEITPAGALLESEEGEILLPKKDLPEGLEVGEKINVFIYTTKDELLATTTTPKAKVGEFAFLEVKEVSRYGAFLDWGLDKDLFVPHGEQRGSGMKEGQKYVVRIYLDKSRRIAASMKYHKFIEENVIPLYEGEEVQLLVADFTDLGVTVIINDLYQGVIYKNDLYRDVEIGERVTGYIHKIRSDKKIDVRLRKHGRAGVEDARDIILEKLRENNNFLPFHDKSPADLIKAELQMSKKKFKMAIGGLYKERLIELSEEGIRLK